ncbi:DnaJ-domain-containing protein [Sporormia fimetaria CBS 119925]|uniref:DnaJ-domain-containing protein n=1 Tax=Sporormia fimetaria CBS 119925 TaxID=1340428 RepID=A0A6A6V8M3_9PLEO|nr:DnaJ-domain-containing protein [Sporormia fimetaria CBS 119925]
MERQRVPGHMRQTFDPTVYEHPIKGRDLVSWRTVDLKKMKWWLEEESWQDQLTDADSTAFSKTYENVVATLETRKDELRAMRDHPQTMSDRTELREFRRSYTGRPGRKRPRHRHPGKKKRRGHGMEEWGEDPLGFRHGDGMLHAEHWHPHMAHEHMHAHHQHYHPAGYGHSHTGMYTHGMPQAPYAPQHARHGQPYQPFQQGFIPAYGLYPQAFASSYGRYPAGFVPHQWQFPTGYASTSQQGAAFEAGHQQGACNCGFGGGFGSGFGAGFGAGLSAQQPMPPQKEGPDLYAVLELTKTATDEEIAKQSKKLKIKWHPDRNKEDGAEEKFKLVNEAARVLTDARRRKCYDETGKTTDSEFEGWERMQQAGGMGM